MDTQGIVNSYSRVIGVDESGKGDYFGPLVVAGVLVSQNDTRELSNEGIRDSKTLSEKQIIEKAHKIKNKLISNVVVINPKKYNELYGKFKNLLPKLTSSKTCGTSLLISSSVLPAASIEKAIFS